MFKLFKSKSASPTFTVADIHNEFDTAEDVLLKQADSLLAELNIPTETDIEQRAKKLSAIGFKKAPAVKQAEKLAIHRREVEAVMVKTKEQADLIRYYKQTYPFQKFLTEYELDRICNKYNLIYAPIDNYTEDVPDKNINEIQTTSVLKSQDSPTDKYFVTISEFWTSCPNDVRKYFKNPLDYTEWASSDSTDPSESDLKKTDKKTWV